MTAHQVGDKVRSNVEAQGMRRGEVFSVVAVVRGPFAIVTYRVRAEDGRELEVRNGHLVLERVLSA
jgi:hypothetical protein